MSRERCSATLRLNARTLLCELGAGHESQHTANVAPGSLQRVHWQGNPEAEWLARTFHETYERLAPHFGYETRRESAVAWEDVPEANRRLMVAVCAELLMRPESSDLARPDESEALLMIERWGDDPQFGQMVDDISRALAEARSEGAKDLPGSP